MTGYQLLLILQAMIFGENVFETTQQTRRKQKNKKKN